MPIVVRQELVMSDDFMVIALSDVILVERFLKVFLFHINLTLSSRHRAL
jgi:Na+-transporting NADH:ubiquinone oxidoreductase subunit NqrD